MRPRQIRNAGLEAAKLRQAAAVIAQVGREISTRGWSRHADTILTEDTCDSRVSRKELQFAILIVPTLLTCPCAFS